MFNVLAYLVVFISQTLSNSSNRIYRLASWLVELDQRKYVQGNAKYSQFDSKILNYAEIVT